MFTRTTRVLAALALVGSLSLTACSSGEPGDGAGEEELITQVTVTLTSSASGAAQMIQATFDEEGVFTGVSPAQVVLAPGVSYTGSIQLRDTINDVDITAEIEDEAEEHLLNYSLDPSSAGTITLTDTESDYTTDDENGGDFAVGLTFRIDVASTASGSGTMTAILYHFDDGPKTGNVAPAGTEIDVEVEVPISFRAASARR